MDTLNSIAPLSRLEPKGHIPATEAIVLVPPLTKKFFNKVNGFSPRMRSDMRKAVWVVADQFLSFVLSVQSKTTIYPVRDNAPRPGEKSY